MSELIKLSSVEQLIVTIRGESIIIDSDVAALYGVQTKRINEAVKNNPDKFPSGYVLVLSENDKTELVENFDRFNRLKHSTSLPNAFTEKGLYMLATILKSDGATATTIAIVETFAKFRELSRTIGELSNTKDEFAQRSLMQRGGDIITDLLGEDIASAETETSVELNFAVFKFKHTVKSKGK